MLIHIMNHIKVIEATKPRYTRARPVLCEAENVAEAKTYEAEPQNLASNILLINGV